jgi:hypothetical protein
VGIDPTTQESGAESAEVVETAAPEETPGTEVPDGEAEATEAETEEQPEEVEEELRVVLPKEQAKQYSNALMGHYAKRLGATPEDLNGNAVLQKAVKQLIDQDIYAQQLEAKVPKEIDSEEEEETEDQPQVSTDDQLAKLIQESSELNDPKFLEAFAGKLAAAKDIPEQLQILTAGMHNYLRSALPKMLEEMQSQQSAQAEHIRSAHERAYKELQKTNLDLPEFNSADFWALYNSALEVVPKLNEAIFTPQERFDTVLRIAQGRKVSAAVVEKAAEAGKKQAEKAQKTAGLGKGLGAGQSKGQIAQQGSGPSLARGYELWKERESNGF